MHTHAHSHTHPQNKQAKTTIVSIDVVTDQGTFCFISDFTIAHC